jgi:polar amino acid transport system substrate-binding protein
MKNLIYILFFFLFACSNKVEDSKNTLVVGTSADNNPLEFVKGGEIVGFDIDLINEIARHLGKTVKIKNMNFQGLIPALHSGDVELLIAGLSATEKRKESLDFSISYERSSMSILTKDGFQISSLQDLQGKILGAQMGSAWYQYAAGLQKEFTDLKIKALGNNLLLVQELALGNIDALIVETCQVDKYKNINENFNSFELEDSKSFLSIVFPKRSGLKDEVDKVISELKDNGYIAFLEEKWFN